MKRRFLTLVGTVLLAGMLLNGCSTNSDNQDTTTITEASVTDASATEAVTASETASPQDAEEDAEALPDGTYTVDFDTDSSMFHVSEACDGKGTLTVKDGVMTIHISLSSKNILNLYYGLAEDAAKDGAELLMPTEDTVTYSDGLTEEVYGFDVPVPALDEEFDLALIGKKGVWYDHKVSVSNPEPIADAETQTNGIGELEDGNYTIEISFEGGSGKAQILSPVSISVSGQSVIATVQWNSPNYDYMIVDGETYLPVNTDGDSVFEIPVCALDEPFVVIGDTVAMSKPHEIEYTLTFHSDTMEPVE